MLQGRLLGMLQNAPHVVMLLDSGGCDFAESTLEAILLAPVVKRLDIDSDPQLFAQVKAVRCACAADWKMHWKNMSSGMAGS